MAALLVATAVNWKELVLTNLGRFLEDSVDQVRGYVVEAWKICDGLRIKEFVVYKAHVAQRGRVARHE